MLLNIESHEGNNYYVYSSFKDGIDYVYVTKYSRKNNYETNNNNNGSFKIHIYQTEQSSENNILVVNEMKDSYIFILMIYIGIVVFFIIGACVDEWELDFIYRNYYKHYVSRHKDVDFIYYVLGNKVIKKIPNSQEGRYTDNIENIGHSIDNYILDRNLLDDFNGTLLEQRENSINDILNNID